MLISIIVLNYNTSKTTQKCLDSILKSKYSNFEIILLDNASTDKNYSYFQKLYSKNKKIKLIHSKKNLYFAGGCNFGAQHAQGQKLIFLNSDTLVDPHWLKPLICLSQKHSRYLVQPKILRLPHKHLLDNAGGIYRFPGFGFSRGHNKTDSNQYHQVIPISYASGTCFLIDKKFFHQLGGFDPWYRYFYEDIDLSLRAKKTKGQCWYCPQSIIYHQGGSSFKSNIPIFHLRKNRLYTIIKNFTGLNRLLRFLTLSLLTLTTPKAIFATLNQTLKSIIIQQRLNELKSFLKKPSFSLLDLGCGDGQLVQLANQQNIKALGVDQNPPPKPKLISSSIENYLSTSGKKLNQKFDVITLYHVLEHLQNPRQILLKLQPWLKTNGVLIIEIPLAGQLAHQDPTHRHFFTKKQIHALLHQTNWNIKKQISPALIFPLKTLFGLHQKIIRLYCHKNQLSLKTKSKLINSPVESPSQFEGITVFHYQYATHSLTNKTVLDVGTGRGHGAHYLAQHQAKSVLGIDYAKKSIKQAQKTFHLPNLKFQLLNAFNLSSLPQKFDLITAFELIEHLPPEQLPFVIPSLSKRLRPNGTCLISTPNRFISSPQQKPSNPFHYQEFTPSELPALFKPYFSKLKLLGISCTNQTFIQKNQKNQKRKIYQLTKLLSQLPLTHYLTPFIPLFIKNKLTQSHHLPTLKASDFKTTTKKIDQSENLFLICQKPKLKT